MQFRSNSELQHELLSMKTVGLSYLALFMFVLILACGTPESEVPQEDIMAKVGNRIITVDEFRESFEFSLSTLRSGANPRRSYLNYMINELLMANEGFRLGLDETRYVTSRMQRRRYDNLLEAFHLKYVHSKIDIPEEDIQEAVLKSTVTWKMLIWPTPSLEDAQQVYAEASQSDLDDYIDKQLATQEVPLKENRFFETGWMDYLDFPPEILEKVVDLEMGVPSEPFPYRGGYAVAQVVDIHREGITEEQLKYGQKRRQIEARLHNIEADRIVRTLMDSIITPMEVRVKGRVVEDLSQPLYDWIRHGLPEQRSLFIELDRVTDKSPEYVKDISGLLDKTLVTFTEGQKTVHEYLEYMDYYREALTQSEDFADFQTRLVTEIGRMIKNDIFVQIAEQDGFTDSTGIKQDLRVWKRKWTYDVYRHNVVKEISVTEEELRRFFQTRWRELGIADIDTARFHKYKDAVHNAVLHEKHLARLEQDLDRLRSRYPVWVNEDALQRLELIADNSDDRASYFLRKNFNFKPALPTVDMKWVGF